jgi:hypothetical protein
MRPVRGLAIALLMLVCAGSALAHGGGTHKGLVSTASGTKPYIAGIGVQVLGGHQKLALRNFTTETVVVFTDRGRPIVRIEPGEARTWADPRITWKGPLPNEQKLLKNWRVPGEVGGKRFAIVGFLGYVPPPGQASGSGAGTSPWLIAAAVIVGVLALAGLGVGARLAGRAPTT